MKRRRFLLAWLMTLLSAGIILADGTSFVGTLASPTATFEANLTLTTTSDVTLQTYGFGGGTNQAGTVIVPGGTDLRDRQRRCISERDVARPIELSVVYGLPARGYRIEFWG